MSRYRIGLMLLGVGTATLLNSGSARGQEGEFFEGCGELVSIDVGCVVFIRDDMPFPFAIGRFAGWEPFQAGDCICVSGIVDPCQSVCDFDYCFLETSILSACIPTLSQWGVIVLVLLLITVGTIVIRTRRRCPYPVCAFVLFVLLGISEPARAQEASITEQVDTMLASPHETAHRAVAPIKLRVSDEALPILCRGRGPGLVFDDVGDALGHLDSGVAVFGADAGEAGLAGG